MDINKVTQHDSPKEAYTMREHDTCIYIRRGRRRPRRCRRWQEKYSFILFYSQWESRWHHSLCIDSFMQFFLCLVSTAMWNSTHTHSHTCTCTSTECTFCSSESTSAILHCAWQIIFLIWTDECFLWVRWKVQLNARNLFWLHFADLVDVGDVLFHKINWNEIIVEDQIGVVWFGFFRLVKQKLSLCNGYLIAVAWLCAINSVWLELIFKGFSLHKFVQNIRKSTILLVCFFLFSSCMLSSKLIVTVCSWTKVICYENKCVMIRVGKMGAFFGPLTMNCYWVHFNTTMLLITKRGLNYTSVATLIHTHTGWSTTHLAYTEA